MAASTGARIDESRPVVGACLTDVAVRDGPHFRAVPVAVAGLFSCASAQLAGRFAVDQREEEAWKE
jgi:hypothetical protein